MDHYFGYILQQRTTLSWSFLKQCMCHSILHGDGAFTDEQEMVVSCRKMKPIRSPSNSKKYSEGFNSLFIRWVNRSIPHVLQWSTTLHRVRIPHLVLFKLSTTCNSRAVATILRLSYFHTAKTVKVTFSKRVNSNRLLIFLWVGSFNSYIGKRYNIFVRRYLQ